MGILCADHVTPLYPRKLALTSPTGGGRSVGIVRSRTKATEFYSVIVSGMMQMDESSWFDHEQRQNNFPYYNNIWKYSTSTACLLTISSNTSNFSSNSPFGSRYLPWFLYQALYIIFFNIMRNLTVYIATRTVRFTNYLLK